MQPRRASRVGLARLLAGGLLGVLLGVPAAGLTPAIADSEPACSAPSGYVVNQWQGQSDPDEVGLWTNPHNWSRGVPGAKDVHQVVCIRTAARVVIPKHKHLRVHVAAIDIAGTSSGPARVVVLATDALFVDAPGKTIVSRVARESLLRLKGAVLGGTGRLEIDGTLTLDALAGHPNVLTSHQCGAVASCAKPPGRGTGRGAIVVPGGGVVRVNRGPTTITDGYRVVVPGGQLVITGTDGQVIADADTRLTLEAGPGDPPAPSLVFDNNGGWYEGANPFLLDPTSVVIDGAVIKKTSGSGTSSIQGHVTATRGVRADVRSGQLAIAGVRPEDVLSVLTRDTSYSTGSCAVTDTYGCTPEATDLDTQIAVVTIPAQADAAAEVTIAEAPASEAAVGRAVVIDGTPADVTRDHPMLLELRYDASVIGTRTPASTAVAMTRRDDDFRNLRACGSKGRIPRHTGACVDRRPGQSRIDDGDLVMVVRTVHFSRYIIT